MSLEDRARLVLTEATLLEVARLGSVLPIAPPRQCPGEVQVGASLQLEVTLPRLGLVQVGDWTLPRGGLVQINLYSLHRNTQHWGDPHTFRPERFISKGAVVTVGYSLVIIILIAGINITQDEWLQPFSYGKRKCIGESVARNTVFLMFANVVKKFNFHVPKSDPLPNEDPVGGLTIGPQTFYAEISIR